MAQAPLALLAHRLRLAPLAHRLRLAPLAHRLRLAPLAHRLRLAPLAHRLRMPAAHGGPDAPQDARACRPHPLHSPSFP